MTHELPEASGLQFPHTVDEDVASEFMFLGRLLRRSQEVRHGKCSAQCPVTEKALKCMNHNIGEYFLLLTFYFGNIV